MLDLVEAEVGKVLLVSVKDLADVKYDSWGKVKVSEVLSDDKFGVLKGFRLGFLQYL